MTINEVYTKYCYTNYNFESIGIRGVGERHTTVIGVQKAGQIVKELIDLEL